VSLNLAGELCYLDAANPTNSLRRTAVAHSGPVTSVAAVPSGELSGGGLGDFASGGDDGRVLTWRGGVAAQDAASADPATRRTHGGKVVGVAALGGGALASVGFDDRLQVAGGAGGGASELSLSAQPVALVAAPAADLLVVGLANGRAVFVRPSACAAGAAAAWFEAALPGPPLALALSGDGAELACSVGAAIHVLAVGAGCLAAAAVLEGHRGLVGCLAYSPDGLWLAAGDANREVKVPVAGPCTRRHE
jgi:WD40 repeat protein